jgi:hypothetical protein
MIGKEMYNSCWGPAFITDKDMQLSQVCLARKNIDTITRVLNTNKTEMVYNNRIQQYIK